MPGTGPLDYFGVLPLLTAAKAATLGDAMTCKGPLYERLWRRSSSPRSTPTRGRRSPRSPRNPARDAGARRPAPAARWWPRTAFRTAFIDPALRHLEHKRREIRFDRRLPPSDLDGERVGGLDFGSETVALGPDDRVVLAVPARSLPLLLPALPRRDVPRHRQRPFQGRSRRPAMPPVLGIVNGTTEWLFAFPGPAFGHDQRRRPLDRHARGKSLRPKSGARCQLYRPAAPLPPWQIVKERRATFAATPEEEAKPPDTRSALANLLLAGDWTRRGFPRRSKAPFAPAISAPPTPFRQTADALMLKEGIDRK